MNAILNKFNHLSDEIVFPRLCSLYDQAGSVVARITDQIYTGSGDSIRRFQIDPLSTGSVYTLVSTIERIIRRIATHKPSNISGIKTVEQCITSIFQKIYPPISVTTDLLGIPVELRKLSADLSFDHLVGAVSSRCGPLVGKIIGLFGRIICYLQALILEIIDIIIGFIENLIGFILNKEISILNKTKNKIGEYKEHTIKKISNTISKAIEAQEEPIRKETAKIVGTYLTKGGIRVAAGLGLCWGLKQLIGVEPLYATAAVTLGYGLWRFSGEIKNFLVEQHNSYDPNFNPKNPLFLKDFCEQYELQPLYPSIAKVVRVVHANKVQTPLSVDLKSVLGIGSGVVSLVCGLGLAGSAVCGGLVYGASRWVGL